MIFQLVAEFQRAFGGEICGESDRTALYLQEMRIGSDGDEGRGWCP